MKNGKCKDKGTFIVKILNEQNSTWQGSVTWVEEQKTQNFRSALELIKMIDEALDEEKELSEQWIKVHGESYVFLGERRRSYENCEENDECKIKYISVIHGARYEKIYNIFQAGLFLNYNRNRPVF